MSVGSMSPTPAVNDSRANAATAATGRQRMLAALGQRLVDRPPVWFMRQAGRQLPGYRALRERSSFLDLCYRPEVNRIASAEPFHVYGVDAVIVFNDILIPLSDMGMGLDFTPAPKFDWLIGEPGDVASLRTPVYDDKTPVSQCLCALREEVGAGTAMLGFIGAPFTVAGFAIGGVGAQRPSLRELVAAKSGTFAAMQERLTAVLADYAKIQVDAGADIIQVFESLADKIEPAEYARVGLPSLLAVIGAIKQRVPNTPMIIFGRGLWPFVGQLGTSGAALSMDQTLPLRHARTALKACGLHNSLQGNLDPEVLRLPAEKAAAQAAALLSQWKDIVPFPARANELGPSGWVFNLGHGVPADADPRTVQAVVDRVRSFQFVSGGGNSEVTQ